MTKVTNIFVSYNIVTDKVVSNNMKTIVHDRKIACYLLVETCANLKYNCKITQTSFRAKYSGLVFMEMRGNFRAVFHPAGDRLDTRRGCAPSLHLYGSLRYVFPFLFGFVETDVYIYGRNDKQ